MPIVPFDVFHQHIRTSTPASVLGLDYGDRRIGVAISDPGLMVSSPLGVVERQKKFSQDAQTLRQMLEKRVIGGIIIGLPVNMDGTEGPRCQVVRSFADNLHRFFQSHNSEFFITYWDERLSTQAMERFLIDEFDTTRQRRKDKIDQLAAAYILDGALGRLRASVTVAPSPP